MLIDLKPTVDALYPIVQGAVVTAVPIVVTWFLARYLHINSQSALSQRVVTAASNGAAYALSQAQGVVDKHAVFDAANPLVVTGAAYVNTALPDTLKSLSVTPDKVNALVAAQLQKQLGAPVPNEPAVIVNPPAPAPAV